MLSLLRFFSFLAVSFAFLPMGFAAASQTSAPVFSVAAGTYHATQNVSITDPTLGVAIYYTTNGTAPTKSSALYQGPVPVTGSTTLRAIAVLPNGTVGPIATSVYALEAASAPVFSLPAGTYKTTQSVTITDPTSGAAIYYTTDGTAPTTSSTPYTGPVSVTNTMTLRAVAALSNGPAGAITTNVYTFVPATAPVFSLAAGTFQTTQNVTITDATSGAAIYYTTNGLAPTTSSTPYTGPVSVTNTTTLRAVAALPNGPAGAITTNVYTFIAATAPVFSVPAGTFQTTQNVTITDATSGAAIYYTTNGIAPTTSSTLYTGPVSVTNTTTLRAVAALPNGPAGAITTNVYTFVAATAPVFNVPAGTFQTAQNVAITDATSGAAIYYTTNGAPPTTSSTRYTGPVSVASTMTLRAVAALPNGPAGAVSTSLYTINLATSTPVFSVAEGTYSTTQNVAISDSTSGASIYYSTNGAAPTASSTLYKGPISVTATTTVKAVAILTGASNSATASATYTISTVALTPAFSVPAGTYSTTQSVAMTTASSGAAIYYTTNGATPTTSSALYTAPVSVTATTTLKAVAALPNASASAAASATYTITPIAGAPVFTLPAGTYATAQSVTLAASTPGSVIYYTTNGAAPTTSSSVYMAPVPVTATTTVKAVAALPSASASTVASATYTIAAAGSSPVFSVPAGSYTTNQNVTITSTLKGAAIYYTTTGIAPTTSSAVYQGAIAVTNNMTLRAIAALPSASPTSVTTAVYTIVPPSAPAFNVPAGTYNTNQTVAITDATPGVAIYYTTTGVAPTTSSTLYTAPLSVTSDMSLRAVAALSNAPMSATTTAAYTIVPAATPVFSVPAGTYNSTQMVAITDATSGAAIYYTTTGVAPTTSSTRYTGPRVGSPQIYRCGRSTALP